MGQQLALIELPPPPPPAPPPVLTTGEAPPTTSPQIGLWFNAVLIVVQDGRRLRLRWRDERVWLGADARDLRSERLRAARRPRARRGLRGRAADARSARAPHRALLPGLQRAARPRRGAARRGGTMTRLIQAARKAALGKGARFAWTVSNSTVRDH